MMIKTTLWMNSTWCLAGGALALCLAVGCKQEPQVPEAVSKLSKEQLERAAKAKADGTLDAKKAAAAKADPAPDKDQPTQRALLLDAGSAQQQELLAKAKSLYLSNRVEAAKPLFEELVKSEPVSGPVVSATIALGDIYAKEGRDQEAVVLYQSLLKREVKVAEVYLVVARAYQRLNRTEDAIVSYENALKLQPYYIFIYADLGALYASLGKNEESAKAYLSYESKIYDYAKLLEDPSATTVDQRLDIADTFSYLGDDRVVQALLNAAKKDPLVPVRVRAIKALEESQAVAALPELVALQGAERDPEVSKALNSAVGALNTLKPTPDDAAAPTISPAEPSKTP